jgi:hypothetical protein
VTADMVRRTLATLDEWLVPGRRYLLVNPADLDAAKNAAAEVGGLTVAHSPAMPPDNVGIVDEVELDNLRKYATVEVVP